MNEKSPTPSPITYVQPGPIGPNAPIDSAGNPLAPQTPVIGAGGPNTPPGNTPYVTPTSPTSGLFGSLSSKVASAAST